MTQADGAVPRTGPDTALVVGTGLIGASVGLALSRAGWRVHLQDQDASALRLAADLGAGEPGLPDEAPAVVIVCTPPGETAAATVALQSRYVQATFSDVASISLRFWLTYIFSAATLAGSSAATARRPGAVRPGRGAGRSVRRPALGAHADRGDHPSSAGGTCCVWSRHAGPSLSLSLRVSTTGLSH